jgi:hypothetical protein
MVCVETQLATFAIPTDLRINLMVQFGQVQVGSTLWQGNVSIWRLGGVKEPTPGVCN